MKCPVDKSVMMVVTHRQIELDFCLKCSGVWLDSGELELLIAVLQSEGADLRPDELLAPEKAEIKARRKCTICGRKMEKVWIGRENKVLIDRCPIGHGLWFDAGELQTVLREMCPPGSPAEADVVTFLGDAFQATHKQPVKE
jgi:Zn-finger nucleic acid-binding protein